ncbi:sporulation related protein [Saccharopolyspora erythraea NRRL 2338]|uniref:Secreted protein n=1 Tax=Saccharopolyspora erythraea (strain ATCC 11635 / DSM 40517 / JCM 4748 / NBRC 13426 / NCIMB 8594 / NRRL 2338) TaxID=405948 RepID=A4FD37_SACEN|nr:phosphodiester glycosidase family protein [Saccharopolyspora erythraea]PFG95709.1 sporulation related protein [Saccharopolyspora erythraea NRRL 2338]QRK92303.1 phosphodiester glycosidase family protein [Saccharopolyspora erythraea]CAM01962.1 secreted protein [Saccharopolyspora erythraea NRRL 2338]
MFRPVGRPAVAGLLAVALAGTFPGAGAAGAADPDPIRDWPRTEVAPGVTLYQGETRGRPGADFWTATVRFAAADGPQHLAGEADAQALAGKLRAGGFEPRVERVDWPAGVDAAPGAVGWRVRTGSFGGRDEAAALERSLDEAGFDALVEWTGADAAPGTGIARTSVVILDPNAFRGELAAGYGTAVAGREKLTEMSARRDALFGVNAGFFVMEDKDGIPGASAGIAAYDGELQSAATNGRIALVLRGDGMRPQLAKLSTEITASARGQQRLVDGVNRVPGKIRNCGGVDGDTPTERPQHDVTCTDPDELVLFTDELGAPTPTGDGVEAVRDRTGRVLEVRPAGGPVPAGGTVVQGLGQAAEWLVAHARAGEPLWVDQQIREESGAPLRLGPSDDIVNGGPELVRDGQVRINLQEDGIIHDAPSFAYTWGLKRNPRSVIGVDAQGRVILATTEGRMPGFSDGWGLPEAAEFVRALGAVDAMALDGGGSAGMVVDDRVVTTPSDATGERAIGDALFLLPRR